MINLLLFDIADPTSSVSLGVLIILTIVVLAMVAVLIGGFVFLLVRRQRHKEANPAFGAQQGVG